MKYWIYPIAPWASAITVNIFKRRLVATLVPVATKKAKVVPKRKMTTSAWIQATVWMSKPNRRAFSSPACGPEPVTRVPKTMTANEVITCTEAIFLVRDAGVSATLGAKRCARKDVAPAIKMMERIKCPATGSGCKSVNTVMPPKTP